MNEKARIAGWLLAFVVLAAAFPASLPAQDLEAGDGGRKPALDPFKVLIKPKKRPRPIRPIRVNRAPVRQGPPPVPPLNLKVTAIAGEPPDYVAIIQYKGKDYIVEKGYQSTDKKFLVRNVYKDRVEVFYELDKSVKTFSFF